MFHLGVNGFDDDNGVIHNNTDGQYQSKNVNRFNEYPNKFRKKNAPTIETGTAIAGIKVDLKS
jgi:hypothetical protein